MFFNFGLNRFYGNNFYWGFDNSLGIARLKHAKVHGLEFEPVVIDDDFFAGDNAGDGLAVSYFGYFINYNEILMNVGKHEACASWYG